MAPANRSPYPWLSLTTPPAAPPEERTALYLDPAAGKAVRASTNSNSRAFPEPAVLVVNAIPGTGLGAGLGVGDGGGDGDGWGDGDGVEPPMTLQVQGV